jgi:hypothetical protein
MVGVLMDNPFYKPVPVLRAGPPGRLSHVSITA